MPPAIAQGVARGLGIFSAALGLVQLVAPRQFARAIGAPDRADRIARFVGVRELAVAPPLLARRRPVSWTVLRVAGDAMDLAMLGMLVAGRHRDGKESRRRALVATAAVAGITAIDAWTTKQLADRPRATTATVLESDREAPAVTAAITVQAEPHDLYALWRDLENLPRFMSHLESVRTAADDPHRSHWVVRGPLNRTVEWDAEIVEDVPDQRIAWRSIAGSPVHHSGVVVFRRAPADRGTEVHVQFDYSLPGGPVAATLAKLLGGEPLQITETDLRRFKQLIETGEVVQSDASLRGTLMSPAQPVAEPPSLAPGGARARVA
jgi:uncharacterized membrane protein